MTKILIIGGVAGGASAAARLRRLDETAKIILFERGEYISFANCGLPYYIGQKITDRSALILQTPKSFQDRFNIDVRVKHEAISIDPVKKTVLVKQIETGKVITETYDKLILSMGAKPILPPISGVDSPKVFTLRNIPDTDRIDHYIRENAVKTAIIVGGGYIGVEMAENLTLRGISVTIVEMGDQVIAPIDYDMACEVHRHLSAKGVNLRLNQAVKAVSESANGLQVSIEEETQQTDMLILAVGVQPESDIAKNAGLAVNARGGIRVSPSMLTSDKDIYAVGDAVETFDFVARQATMVALAGPANKQGRIAADNICGLSSQYAGAQGSAILKVFDLTVASTGINEKSAQKLGLRYEKSFTFSPSHASYYPGANIISIKTLFEPETGKILGAQLVGYEGTDKRCDVFATSIRFGATAKDLTKLELCYAPPFSSAKDPVNMAGYVIENVLNGQVNLFHWHDIPSLIKQEDCIFIDVRTKAEFENGGIEGFINYPLETLRTRADELDRRKTIYVTCQVGMRGYLACRILMQLGFTCYNLSGGYRLYQSIFKSPAQLKPNHSKTQASAHESQEKSLHLAASEAQSSN